MRINVNIDDNLKLLAEQKAKSLGLTLSAFIRFLLSRETKDFKDKVDRLVIKTEAQGYETPESWENFKEALDQVIRDAKN